MKKLRNDTFKKNYFYNQFYNCFGKKYVKQAIMVVCLCNLQDRTYSHAYT